MRISDWSSDVCSSDLPDIQGNARYSLIEASADKGGSKLHIMRDDNNKPLNVIDGTALHNIESKRLIPARSALLRLEATQSKTNMVTLMGERIAAAADKHLNSMMAFVALQDRKSTRLNSSH